MHDMALQVKNIVDRLVKLEVKFSCVQGQNGLSKQPFWDTNQLIRKGTYRTASNCIKILSMEK